MFQFANVAVEGYEDISIGHGKPNGYMYNYIVEWYSTTTVTLVIT
jgi:hypothetical protein